MQQVLLSTAITCVSLENGLQKEKMARLSSFLWLLSLMACFCNSQSNTRMTIKLMSVHIQISENVELACDISNSDSGVHWIHQNRTYTSQSIVFISARGKMTPERIVGFSATKSGTTYKLTVQSFKEKNQGIYYCAAHQGQNLIFSQGLQVYLPVTTTTTPTTTTQRSTTQTQATNIQCDPSASEKELSGNSLKFSCALYIWIPLAGGCFLLLIILVITLSICCDPRRRRRTCRCHRPMNGINGKHSLPH